MYVTSLSSDVSPSPACVVVYPSGPGRRGGFHFGAGAGGLRGESRVASICSRSFASPCKSCAAVPCRAMPCRIVPCRAVPGRAGAGVVAGIPSVLRRSRGQAIGASDELVSPRIELVGRRHAATFLEGGCTKYTKSCCFLRWWPAAFRSFRKRTFT